MRNKDDFGRVMYDRLWVQEGRYGLDLDNIFVVKELFPIGDRVEFVRADLIKELHPSPYDASKL